MLIAWSDEYATGIPELDSRHKALHWLANGLDQAFRAGNEPETLATILSIFADYASYHFVHGQRLLPRVPEYAALHDELLARLDELVYQLETGQTDVSTETLDFLRDWLMRLAAQHKAVSGRPANSLDQPADPVGA